MTTSWRPRDLREACCSRHSVWFWKNELGNGINPNIRNMFRHLYRNGNRKKIRKSKVFRFPRKLFLKSKYLKAQSSLTGSRLKNDRKWAGPLNYTKLGLFEIGCSDLTRTRSHEYFGRDQNGSLAGSYLTNNAYARAFVSVDAGRKQ